ncbi:MAG: hypothetical protein JXA03_02245 [Bacteroidales bacterium]|nr:hypothetical protein [Bacteroidales bacterium]
MKHCAFSQSGVLIILLIFHSMSFSQDSPVNRHMANSVSDCSDVENSPCLPSIMCDINGTDNLNNFLHFKVTGNGYTDITLIGFHPDATEGFDSDFDAYKIMGIYAAPQFYSVIPGTDLSVNILPAAYNGRVVQLGFEVGYDTTYTLTVTGTGNLQPGVNIFLEDKLSPFDRYIHLNKTPVCTFYAGPGEDPFRFRLHYHVGQQPGGLYLQKEDVRIYSDDKTIYIVSKYPEKADGVAEIYNISGGLEYRGDLKPLQLNTINFEEKFGYYIVKVINNAYFCTGKVYIR